MKSKKTLKKALAGISAFAMIGTTLPTSLLASAVSYTNVIQTDTSNAATATSGFGKLSYEFGQAKEVKSNLLPGPATKDAMYDIATQRVSTTTLDTFDFRLEKYEVKDSLVTDERVQNQTEASGDKITYTVTKNHAVEWDTEKAAKDVAELLGEDVVSVSFYDDPDEPQYGSDAYGEKNDVEYKSDFVENRYGKIKTITMRVPVNTGTGLAGEMKYEEKEFFVVRTGKDIADYSEKIGGEYGIILARDINLVTGYDKTKGATIATGQEANAAKASYQASIIASAQKLVIDAINKKLSEDKIVLTTAVAKNKIYNESLVGSRVAGLNFTGTTHTQKAAQAIIDDLKDDTGVLEDTKVAAEGDTEQTVLNTIIDKIKSYSTTPGAKLNKYFNEASAATKGIFDANGKFADNKNFATWYADLNKIDEQVTFNVHMNIALNGCTLTTADGIQANGKKLRIYGSDDGTSGNNTITAGVNKTVLIAYGGANVELYDNVKINVTSASNKSAVTGSRGGTLVMCGDNVTVEASGSSVGVLDVGETKLQFQKGDYTYANLVGGTAITDPTAANVKGFKTTKVHKFNKYGLEVDTRADDTTNAGKKLIAESTNYTDADLRTPEINYAFEPAYKTTTYKTNSNGATTPDDWAVTSGTLTAPNNMTADTDSDGNPDIPDIYITNLGQLMWFSKNYSTIATTFSNDDTLTVHIDGEIDFNDAPSSLVWTPIDARKTTSVDPAAKLVINGASTTDSQTHLDYDDNGTAKKYKANTYSVIKNMRIASADGNAAMFASTGLGTGSNPGNGAIGNATSHKVEIKNLGFENAVVNATKAKSYAAVVVGEAYDTLIENVYVADPTVSGTYKAAIAGSFNNGSTIEHTFSYSAYDSVFAFVDEGSKTQLIANNTEKDIWHTNFFAVDYPGIDLDSLGATPVYFVSATVEEFASGKVAFMLNGHDPEFEFNSGNGLPKEWNDGKNDAATASGASVNYASASTSGSKITATPSGEEYYAPNWYKKTYSQDIFGQTIGTDKYPTFIVGAMTTNDVSADQYGNNIADGVFLEDGTTPANEYTDADGIATGKALADKVDGSLATNRVYRQISQDCSEHRDEWTKTNAVFSNKELHDTNTHDDKDGNGRCDLCDAYKIDYVAKNGTKFFDETLWTGLKEAQSGDWITLRSIGATTSVLFDLRKVSNPSGKTVAEIIDTINNSNASYKCDIVGFDLLNMDFSDGALKNTKAVVNINFRVDDSIKCGMGDSEKLEDTAYPIGAVAYNTGYAFVRAGTGTINERTDVEHLEAGSPKKGDLIHYYVFADMDTNYGRRASASFKVANVSNFATKLKQAYNYRIEFARLEHNKNVGMDTAYKDGLFAYGIFDDRTAATAGSRLHQGTVKDPDCGNKIPAAYHTEYYSACYCIANEEPHKATYAITNEGHLGVCEKVGCKHTAITATTDGVTITNSSGINVTTTGYEPHAFEVVSTFGSLVLKRCVTCGYTATSNEVSIVAESSKPELSVVEASVDGKTSTAYRQAYNFNVIAGEDEIVSYGIIYNKDNAHEVDPANIKLTGTGAYFTKDGVLDKTALDKAGLEATSKNIIKTSGTYSVFKTYATADDLFSLCGYIVYKDKSASNAIKVEKTDVMSKSFKSAAQEIVDESCQISAVRTNDTATKDVNTYVMDLSNGFVAVEVGDIWTKNAATPVTDKTEIADVDGTDIKVTTNNKLQATWQSINVRHGVTRVTASVPTTGRGYLKVTHPDFGKDLSFYVYSDVLPS